jgi:CRISPR-associated protein Cmr6
MRAVLQKVKDIPSHLGLAYDAWAPTLKSGKLVDADRGAWIEKLANSSIHSHYKEAYKVWRNSFRGPEHRCFELNLQSRMLVGQGNSSATDVGLTVHHTWGAPLLPGSAIKGLLAHYIDICYGLDKPELPFWQQPEDQIDRIDFQGLVWNERGNRIQRGPGKLYRRIFGSPDAVEDEQMVEHGFEAGACKGEIIFHDALYVPGDMKPFAPDVITVHQKEYYNRAGKSFPNDFDSPNPVSFLTVRPKVGFLFVLSGPEDLMQLTEKLLKDALSEWGIGAKTSAGYGRFMRESISNAKLVQRKTSAVESNTKMSTQDNSIVAQLTVRETVILESDSKNQKAQVKCGDGQLTTCKGLPAYPALTRGSKVTADVLRQNGKPISAIFKSFDRKS